MKGRKATASGTASRRPARHQPFDEADWVDWDHWQTVEELQNFMNGLADVSTPDRAIYAHTSDDGRQSGQIARQIHRHGLEVDG